MEGGARLGRAPSVRRAGPADLDTLCELWLEVARHHAGLDPGFGLRPNARDEVRRLLAAELGDPEAAAWLAGDGAADGFCIARIDRAPPIHEQTLRAEITDLGVRPAARRRGLGRALVDAALRWVRERGVAHVEVRVMVANHEGQGFWRALGFGEFMDVLRHRL